MNQRYQFRRIALGFALATAIPAYALAQQTTEETAVTSTAHELKREESTLTATVVSVDQENRQVVLKGPKGNEETVKAGPEIKNLDQLHAGDLVTAKYERAVALELLPADSAEAGMEYQNGMKTAEKGATPGGTADQSVSVTSKLTAVDLKNHTVTLTGADGKSRVIEVKDPKRQAKMKELKVGQMVRITYVEALAISVTKGKAKK
jgi:O-phosphoseryl-tRNA(Cys) synthetase